MKGLILICGCLPPPKPRFNTRAPHARNRPSIAHADPNLGQMGCNSMQGSTFYILRRNREPINVNIIITAEKKLL